jgi:hypothetical protein
MTFGFCPAKTVFYRIPTWVATVALGFLLAAGKLVDAAEPRCASFMDSLHLEYQSGDPGFLIRDVDSQNCSPEEKQDAYYHQALGNLILGNPKAGILYLKAALDYPGPFRESSWLELWRAAQKTQDSELANEAILGLYREFPGSKYLAGMLNSPAPVAAPTQKPKRPGRKPWTLGTQHLLSTHHEPGYARDYMDHRLQGTWSLALGEHRFSPGFQTGVVHDFNLDSGLPLSKRMELATWSGELSLGYLFRWLFGSISTGTRYDFLRHTYADTSSQGMSSSFVGWNYPQWGASMGARIPISPSIQWFAFATGNRFNSQFSSVSLNNSLMMDQGAWSHQATVALERMFLDLPELDTALQLQTIPGVYQTERKQLIGLWADEFSYVLDYRRPTWQGLWSASFREERRVVKAGADSVLASLKGDPLNTFYIPGDSPATERQASLGFEWRWIFSSRFQLKSGFRTGYLWTTSPDSATEESGMTFQASIRLSTRF